MSTRQSIRLIVEGDREDEGAERVVLFRDPTTGCEVFYEASASALRRVLCRAGYPELASRTHSLRIWGGTVYANSPSGGELYDGFMGLWRSEARLDFLHACAPRLEADGVLIGRESEMELAEKPGAVSSCGGPSRR